MTRMPQKIRLSLIMLTMLGSVIYATLVICSAEFANTITAGYVGFLLSVFLVIETWKKQ